MQLINTTMISFKDFLAEARLAPLYHGTTTENLIGIIQTGTLNSSVEWDGQRALSLTRSLKFAKEWAAHQSTEPFVIELDQQKLLHRYSIKPFNFFNGKARFLNEPFGSMNGQNEYEERITQRDINNIDKYITKIIAIRKPGKPMGGRADVILKHPKLYYNGKFVNR